VGRGHPPALKSGAPLLKGGAPVLKGGAPPFNCEGWSGVWDGGGAEGEGGGGLSVSAGWVGGRGLA
jgi:hypothetical protein